MRHILLLLLATFAFAGAAEVDAAAVESLALGNVALEKADGDPSQNLVAALAFAKALPAYEAAGDQETAAELKSVIFWCKKRMDIGMLEQFVASKGTDGEALSIAVAKIEQPIAAGEAKDYLSRAEAYAQKNPGQSLKIAIRYFEVADRFQGTPESLKAQRLSLEALQKSMIGRPVADPTLSMDLHAGAIAAGDLPEAAKKLIEQSNQSVDALAAQASQDLALDRRKAVDVVLREAEAAQKRGDLDPMIAHQNQAANIDKDYPGLSKTATAAIEAYRKARAKNVAKANGDIAAERKRLTQSLLQVQRDETKKGNTTGALAIKQAIENIDKASQAVVADAGKKAAEQPTTPAKVDGAQPIVGKWAVSYSNGQKAELEIKQVQANLLLTRLTGYANGRNYRLTYDAKREYYSGTGFDGGKIEFYTVQDGVLKVKHCQTEDRFDNPNQTGTGKKMDGQGQPSKSVSLASVLLSGYEIDELKVGIRTNSNRAYLWTDIPQELIGVHFVRHAGGAAKSITCEIKKPGVVYVGAMDDSAASADEYLVKEGWAKTGIFFPFQNGKGTVVNVYARPMNAGKLTISAAPFGWGGPILIGDLTKD